MEGGGLFGGAAEKGHLSNRSSHAGGLARHAGSGASWRSYLILGMEGREGLAALSLSSRS
jgi:hypothetical protein